ncbi:hypothetical protein [Streptomyces sp. NPDC059009]|uniref:hypothetical protein n=1 Tax=Streptomyces sp. NPDC059009 TaxID=3346694 RepID=UPI003682DF42
MTPNITVHADAVLVDIDHLADRTGQERSALAAFLTGRTWGALTEQGFAGAAARCAAAGLPEPALLATGAACPQTFTAAADLLGTAIGSCAVLTATLASTEAAGTAGAIPLALDAPPHATTGCGALPLPSLTALAARPASPWRMAFTA